MTLLPRCTLGGHWCVHMACWSPQLPRQHFSLVCFTPLRLCSLPWGKLCGGFHSCGIYTFACCHVVCRTCVVAT